jgi:hypothetical protein
MKQYKVILLKGSKQVGEAIIGAIDIETAEYMGMAMFRSMVRWQMLYRVEVVEA